MITKMFNAIKEALHSLDIGDEESQAFAEEIKRRGLLVKKLRMLVVEAEGISASLPTLPVENWFDGTVEDATIDVYFENYDLAQLLQFIADVGVSFDG